MRDEATFGSSEAFIAGFEYTFFDVYNGHDVGLITEYLYDEMGKTRTSFEDDLFFGIRYTFNDLGSSEMLAGAFVDMDNGSQSLRLKIQRRSNNYWKYEIIAQSYNKIDPDDLFYASIKDDDFLRFNIRYYF